MPDHFHGIVRIIVRDQSPARTVGVGLRANPLSLPRSQDIQYPTRNFLLCGLSRPEFIGGRSHRCHLTGLRKEEVSRIDEV